MIAPETVLEAAARLNGIALRTPVMTSRTLDSLTGGRVFLKCENFQRVGAFKFRGAYNAISRLGETERAAGVITHSSGNHAQGLALAARLLSVRAVVVMPHDSPAAKRAATLGYGAEVVECDPLYREEVTAGLIAEHGYTLIHPYDNDDIIAGQGTAALELHDESGPLDLLFVPVGGGGLISGCALATRLRAPGCRVIGVEPEIAADAGRSWRENDIIRLEKVPETIADGLRTRAIGHRNLSVMRRYVHDMITVSEEAILETVEFVWSRLKIVIEPSAAVALAPLLIGRYPMTGLRAGVILSGGNVDVSNCGFFHRPRPASTAKPGALHDTASEPSTTRPKVLVCADLDDHSLKLLRAQAQVDLLPDPDEETLSRRIAEYQALIVGPRRLVSNHLIKDGYNLQVIGSLSNHPDNIDVSAARAMGIEVCYLPDSRAVAIAEHTIGRLLTLANRFGDGQLAGKTLGIIGFGLVGRLVAQRASAFEMQVLINQPRLTAELALASDLEVVDLVDLLRRSDFVSLHVPYRQETTAILSAEELSLMRPSAMLVNCGHTDLVDEPALLRTLEKGLVAGAALSDLPPGLAAPSSDALALRRHSRVYLAPHVTTLLDSHPTQTTPEALVRQVLVALQARRTSESLSLLVVPVEQVTPHERIDEKRVGRLMQRLEEEGKLVNPPITTYWKGRYVVLDGATRFASMQRLGYPFIIIQSVDREQPGFQLHTWYHAISVDADTPQPRDISGLLAALGKLDGLELQPMPAGAAHGPLEEPDGLCYLLDRQGQTWLARIAPHADKLRVMNNMVDAYSEWGSVERTLLTDIERLAIQFPQLVAVAVFPQFAPEEVFDAATAGDFLPAGLTRFVIPGRILRLNADLDRLKQPETLAEKRAWFNELVAGKLSRSRMRYYQEPVILLDE